MTPSVSVIIPSYNRANCLVATLDSVFGQSLEPAEVWLVDDGSQDDSEQVVTQYKSEHPTRGSRLFYHRQENQGKSVALNFALDRAQGDWIAFNDSDDLWSPQKLEEQFQVLNRFPECGACFTDAQFINHPTLTTTAFGRAHKVYSDSTGFIPDGARLILDAPHGVFMQTVVVRKEVMGQVGKFDPRFRVSQDTDFLFRLGLKTSLCFVSAPLVQIDRTEDRARGLTKDHGRKTLLRLQALEMIYDKWLKLAAQDRKDLCREILARLSRLRNEIAGLHIEHGNRAEAGNALRQALAARLSVRLLAKYILLLAAPSLLDRKYSKPHASAV